MNRTAAVALGSNLASQFGSPEATLHAAVERAGALGEVTAVSSFYGTRPVGFIDQPDFVNGALLLLTLLAPPALMLGLLEIERAMGRDRTHSPAKGPRIIDLDLLLMDNLVIATPEVILPHPAMTERRFVLEPLAEIAPQMIHPIVQCTVAELLARLR